MSNLYLVFTELDPLGLPGRLTFDLPKSRVDAFPLRFGGMTSPRVDRIVSIDWGPPGPGAEAMRADGWRLVCDVWERHDGGRIEHRRQQSGRYCERLPTNRKRKREQAKALRRKRAALARPRRLAIPCPHEAR